LNLHWVEKLPNVIIPEVQMEKTFYCDEPCVVSFFIGELGWLISAWQGYLRHAKHHIFKDHKFIFFVNKDLAVLTRDFVDYSFDLPEFFYNLNLEADCYEAPLPNSSPGALTPPDVYSNLLQYFRQFYNMEKAVELFPPRGYNNIVYERQQLFTRYSSDAVMPEDRKIITVMPRGRARTPQRNVPEFIWKEVVDNLKNFFTVVLVGTHSGSFLADYEDENVINLISEVMPDKLERAMDFLCNSVCSVGSQSGTTHLSLACGCPSYIIGHEEKRHCKEQNFWNTPTSFRYVNDYRAIDANTILSDIDGFLAELTKSGYYDNKVIDAKAIIEKDFRLLFNLVHDTLTFDFPKRPALRDLVRQKDLVGAEIGVFTGGNSRDMFNTLDISKLYLIDPFAINDTRNFVVETLHEFSDRLVWVQKSSHIVTKDDIPEELDFVYVDGDHTYEGCLKDIEIFYPMVKSCGIIGGHDYDTETGGNGVIRAVTDYFSKLNIEVFSTVCPDDTRSHDWWVFKP